MVLEFTVDGKPMGKQRPRFSRAGKFVRTYTPKKTLDYEANVRESFKSKSGYDGKLLEGAIKAEICAIFEPPKSISKRKRQQMLNGEIPYISKPDFDNIGKAICDALNGVAYKDDSAINDCRVVKMYGNKSEAQIRLSDDKHVICPIFTISKEETIEQPSN